MVRLTVAEMNTKLVQLNTFFGHKTQEFTHKISLHEGRITSSDIKDFEVLIHHLKEQVMNRIQGFINERFNERSSVYQTEISKYNQANYQVDNDLRQFSAYLQESTIELKSEQNRKENILENLSRKFSQNMIMKKVWKALNDYRLEMRNQKIINDKMDQVYRNNLIKKSFFPWRTLTYKQGYQNTVRRQTQVDIMNINEQYKSIIQILKTKINETDNLIKVKKAAKGQFTYALSKNLLKTISNLSLQVMSLNQISLRDQQFANQSTEQFMDSVDALIKEKLTKVREYKSEISGQNQQYGQRRKKITFM